MGDFFDRRRESVGTKTKWGDSSLEKYLLKDLWFGSFKTLVRAQKLAAKEAGFSSTYGLTRDEQATNKINEEQGIPNVDDGPYQTSWSSLYRDRQYEQPTAHSWQQLQGQLDEIDSYTDRTSAQQNYLAQKLLNRYYLQAVINIGGNNAIVDFLTTKSEPTTAGSGGRFADTSPYNYIYKNLGSAPPEDLKNWDVNDEDSKYRQMLSGTLMPFGNVGEGMLLDHVGKYAAEYITSNVASKSTYLGRKASGSMGEYNRAGLDEAHLKLADQYIVQNEHVLSQYSHPDRR